MKKKKFGETYINGPPNCWSEYKNICVSCGQQKLLKERRLAIRQYGHDYLLCDVGQHSSPRSHIKELLAAGLETVQSQQYGPSLTKTNLGTATAHSSIINLSTSHPPSGRWLQRNLSILSLMKRAEIYCTSVQVILDFTAFHALKDFHP